MAKRMKGQFFILAAFIVGMYIFFILQMFTSTRTSFKVPNVPQVSYVFDAAQDALDEEGSINVIQEALAFIQEPIGLRCTALGSGKGSCDLYEDEWACGANLTVVYRGTVDVETTRTIHSGEFALPYQRTPIHVMPNASATLVKVSHTVGDDGVLKDTNGNTVRGSWSGNTVTFRVNLIKDRPKVVHVYHTTASSQTIYEDVGILNGGSYDASRLYKEVSPDRDTQNLTLGDLSNLKNNAGPRMLIIPGGYPGGYGGNLLDYVEQGGILVSAHGLCTEAGSCLVGNMEQITGGHTLTAMGDFSGLNPVTTNSEYFTDADLTWLAYTSGTTNTSRAAAGATAYGEGYVVFLGNESMLDSWSQLGSFLDDLLLWGVAPVSTTVTDCPVQSP